MKRTRTKWYIIIILVCIATGISYVVLRGKLLNNKIDRPLNKKTDRPLNSKTESVRHFYESDYKYIKEDSKMRRAIPVWKYSQVHNNHYYHLEKEKTNDYALYEDMIEIGTFTLEDTYVPTSFLVKDNYAVCVMSNEMEDAIDIETRCVLVKIDFDNWQVTNICDLNFARRDGTYTTIYDDLMYEYLIFCNNFVYLIDNNAKTIFCYDLNKKELSELAISPEMKKAIPYINIIEDEFLYANEKNGKVDLFSQKIGGQQNKICSVTIDKEQNNKDLDADLDEFQDDEGYIISNNATERNVYYDGSYYYYKRYMIDKNTFECKTLKNARCYNSGNIAFGYNAKYVYYLNDHYQLERYNKKSGKIKKYGKSKYSDLTVTSNGCYLKTYKKGMEPGIDAGFETDRSEPKLMSWEEKTDIVLKK